MARREARAPIWTALLAAFIAVCLTRPSTGEERRQKGPQSAKPLLTSENFRELHALIRPHDNEWRHLRVDWLTDVVAARKKAAAEDKPLVICYTGGAGYNEPLGTC